MYRFFVVLHLPSHVWLFVTPWTAAFLVSLFITDSRSLHKLMSIESMILNHLILCLPFSSCPQSFPASGSFPMSQLFTSGSWSTGASASASVLPMNIQNWFPLGLIGLISLLSKGLSKAFSSTMVQKHLFYCYWAFQLGDITNDAIVNILIYHMCLGNVMTFCRAHT